MNDATTRFLVFQGAGHRAIEVLVVIVLLVAVLAGAFIVLMILAGIPDAIHAVAGFLWHGKFGRKIGAIVAFSAAAVAIIGFIADNAIIGGIGIGVGVIDLLLMEAW
jgi:hypothetical protein